MKPSCRYLAILWLWGAGVAYGGQTADQVLLRESCSPRDAASTEILALPDPVLQYRLRINVWGMDRPRRTAGSAEVIRNENDGPGRRTFRASYCPQREVCVWIVRFHVKITLDKDGQGQAEIEFETKEHGASKIVAPAVFPRAKREPCG